MSFVETLTERNGEFAQTGYISGLKMLPSQRSIIVGCVDPRVDPYDVLKLKPGEAIVIRNIAGRIDMTTLQTVTVLQKIAQAAGKTLGEGWSLIVLHHTDCGVKVADRVAPDLLADALRVKRGDLESLAVNDPYRAVALDVAALRASGQLPDEVAIVGMVYDVESGRVDTIVPPGSAAGARARLPTSRDGQ